MRGVGSNFYIVCALGSGHLWRVVALVIVGSIFVHGVSATPVMRMLDRIRAGESLTERLGKEEAMAAQSSPVKPDVLRWAVDEDGRAPDDLASALKIEPELFQSWHTGDAAPTRGQVSNLARRTSSCATAAG